MYFNSWLKLVKQNIFGEISRFPNFCPKNLCRSFPFKLLNLSDLDIENLIWT